MQQADWHPPTTKSDNRETGPAQREPREVAPAVTGRIEHNTPRPSRVPVLGLDTEQFRPGYLLGRTALSPQEEKTFKMDGNTQYGVLCSHEDELGFCINTNLKRARFQNTEDKIEMG